jgi:type I restriction enzyme S subunit
MPDLESLRIPLPPLDEQRRIADFLDAETSRIDRLLALRTQARSAVMLRTTAQLDLTVENLASTYRTSPFRRGITSIEQGSSPQCDNVAADPDSWGVLKVSAVKNGCFVQEENKQLPPGVEPERRYEIKHGDLLITRANTPNLVGAAAIAESPRSKLMLCDKIFRIKTTQDLIPEFLALVSLSTRIRSTCAEASHGTSASMVNLKTEEIKQWPVPQAPVSVQLDVVEELAATRELAAAAVDAIDRQLALLAERRQALITAAVTGQIDVATARGAAA